MDSEGIVSDFLFTELDPYFAVEPYFSVIAREENLFPITDSIPPAETRGWDSRFGYDVILRGYGTKLLSFWESGNDGFFESDIFGFYLIDWTAEWGLGDLCKADLLRFQGDTIGCDGNPVFRRDPCKGERWELFRFILREENDKWSLHRFFSNSSFLNQQTEEIGLIHNINKNEHA